MEITLTVAELAFLRGLLKPYLQYYSTLVQSARCSPSNRAKFEDLSQLDAKLVPKEIP